MVKAVTHRGEYNHIHPIRFRIEIPYIGHVGYVKKDFEISPYIQRRYFHIREASRFERIALAFKKWALSRVPIRSGKLIDTMLNSLEITPKYGSTNKMVMDANFDIPIDRPRIIHGKTRHRPPDEGYAEFYPVQDTDVQARVRLKRYSNLRTGKPLKNPVYSLNDPTSINRFEQAGLKVLENQIIKDANNFLKDIKVTMEYK